MPCLRTPLASLRLACLAGLLGLLALAAPAGAQTGTLVPDGDPTWINFQPAASALPTGYDFADTGAPYGAQADGTYGWLKTADDQPVDASSATRDRERGGVAPELDTFNHLERGDCCDSGFQDEIYWQIDLPDGVYAVTVSFGDQPGSSSGYDSQHQVTLEGEVVPAVPFQGDAAQEFLQQTAVVEVTDGALTMRPTADGVNTKVNYVHVQPLTEGSAPPQAVRLNAGGPALATSLGDFDADAFTNGLSETSSKSFDVLGTEDDDLYLTYRYGENNAGSVPGEAFGYAVPVVNGTYTVTLHFLEPYFGVTGPSGSGQRVFDVDVEGGQGTLSDFDLNAIADGGPQQAVTRTFAGVAVTDGTLDVAFSSTVNNAIVSAIEVVPAGAVNTPPTVVGPIANVQVEQDAADLDVDLAGVFTDAEDDDATLALAVASNTDPALVSTSLAGSVLTLDFAAGQTGTATLTVRATDSGGLSADAAFTVTVTLPAAAYDLSVNFQSEDAAVPGGHVRDFGQPFGPRTDADQGGGQHSYGWVEPGTDVPLSLVGNGRDRGDTPDQLFDTFMHMQGDDVAAFSGGFNGVAAEGAWELALPAGRYEVEVVVGDPNQPQPGGVPEVYTLNVEGARAVTNFEPVGGDGAATRRTTATVVVEVTDGRLTLDAVGDARTSNTKIAAVSVTGTTAWPRPHVTGTAPAPFAEEVDPSAFVAADLYLPASVTPNGVDPATLSSETVRLYPADDPAALVPLNVNDTGGQDAIVATPLAPLAPETWYTFEVTDGVTDLAGAPFLRHTTSFETGAATACDPCTVAFEKVTVDDPADGEKYSSLAFGPDGRLYALLSDGRMRRWTVEPDGTLSGEETLGALNAAQGARLAIGLAFDPAATAGDLVAYVSHSQFAFSNGNDWEGVVSRLSGPDLATVEDVVVGLPRSTKDHVTNGLAFGPDGALYVNQGSNTAMGAPDNTWGNRPERFLAAAVLRIDLEAIASTPLDVQTEEGGSYPAQTYDPSGANPPVTVYAGGLRNAYDLVWHTNGRLYVPTNGSAGGGNAPAGPGGTPPALFGLPTQPDLLFDVPGPSAFTYHTYGHPNPARGEYVLNGGNPTAGSDPLEVAQYPVGTVPEVTYAGAAYDFGNSKSPNGVIEYRGGAFGGALRGKLLVVRFSGGDDIMALTPGPDGDIASAETGIEGFTGFDDPLDLVEHLPTGFLYVSEYDRNGQNQKLTLLRHNSTGGAPLLAAGRDEVVVSGFVSATKPDATVEVTLTNEGGAPLSVTGAVLAGADAGAFSVAPTTLSLAPGASAPLTLTFDPASVGVKEAVLEVASDGGAVSIPVYGLAAQNWEGNGEPPLALIVEALGYAIDVGFTTLASDGNSFPIGDEVLVDLFTRAGSGPVEIVPVARYAPDFEVPFGWYEPGTATPTTHLVGTLSGLGDVNADPIDPPHHQMLYPPLVDGPTSYAPAPLTFDPGDQAFGLFAESPQHIGYTEDAINDPTNVGSLHRTRIYPLKDRSGAPIPNSYLVGFEEAHNHDHNDYVFVVSNVTPAAADGLLLADADALDFGAVETDGAATLTLTLTNGGSTAIALSDVTLAGDAAFTLVTDPVPGSVPAGGTVGLDVAFAPTATGPAAATLTVEHDGTDAPLVVDLAGLGIAPNDALWRVNVAGADYTDPQGRLWSAETGLVPGGDSQTSSNTSGIGDIVGTDADALYLARRYGSDFTFELPVPDGTYTVRLHFAEIHWGVKGSGLNPPDGDPAGERLFDVTAEGTPAVDDLDLYQTAGPATAYVETIPDVAVADGGLTLHFTVEGAADNAIVQGIEVLEQSAPPAVAVDVPVTAGWNLVSLAADAPDAAPAAVFPTAVEGTLSGYVPGGAYEAATTLTPGHGYWLLFPAATTQSVAGAALTSASVDLVAGWNLLGGLSCTAAVDGAGVLAEAPLYRFAQGYVPTATVTPGEAVWALAAADGSVTLSCAPAAKRAAQPALAAVDGALSLVVEDAAGARRTLWLAAHADAGADPEAYLLPPPPPRGAFDARFEGGAARGGSRLLHADALASGAVLALRGAEGPVRLTLAGAEGTDVTYLVEAGGGAERLLRAGGSVELTAGVEAVRLRAATDADMPDAFALHGNYPNPFNPSTAIRFDLPEDAEVSVEVYNLLGRRVMALPAQNVPAGAGRTLRLDGATLASGVYFYRLRAETPGDVHQATGRFTLVK